MLFWLQAVYNIQGAILLSLTKDALDWTNGTLDLNATSSEVVATLDSGYKVSGNLTSCECIQWNDQQLIKWLKVPDTEEVHVIFMNHLDVGYDGIDPTGFINNVLNVYFDEYFPRAISLAAELAMNVSSNRQFVYTTHPWLVYLYLNCPNNVTLNNIQLHCPSPSSVKTFEDAIDKGFIRWHAGPMNMQMELLNEKMVDIAMWFSAQLDKTYLQKPAGYSRVWSLRDVPGMTKSVISHFLKNNIVAVSVGVNPSSSPPDLPDLFLWKESADDEDGLIGFWNKGGYPAIPGTSLSSPVGLAIRRTVFSPVDKQALVFAFRTDNSGPPENTDEILSNYDVIEKEYPNAAVHASTFESFVSKITKSSLPVVTKEVGDTWIQGVSSDPRKISLYRAAARALDCSPPECVWNWDAVKDFALFLIKLPEHTWGLPSVYDDSKWTNKDFQTMLNKTYFVAGVQSWVEQRQFFNLTMDAAARSSSSQWFVRNLKKELTDLHPSLPSLESYVESDVMATHMVNTTGGHLKIQFLKTGAIGYLSFTGHSGSSMSLASKGYPLGELQYYTYNGSDFDFMNSRYNYYGNAGFSKPFSDENAHPNSTVSAFSLQNFYTNRTNTNDGKWHFLMELAGDSFKHTYYGSPETVWILVKAGPSSSSASSLFEIDFEVTFFNKTATRLPEATMFSFTPYGSAYRGFYQKISASSSIPFESVVLNGSQYQHAVESVTLVGSLPGTMSYVTIELVSPDIAVVCPILTNETFKTPTPFSAPLDPVNANEVKGVAFNIHNNIWNTNYPLWYPFVEEDRDFKSRYTMTVSENSELI